MNHSIYFNLYTHLNYYKRQKGSFIERENDLGETEVEQNIFEKHIKVFYTESNGVIEFIKVNQIVFPLFYINKYIHIIIYIYLYTNEAQQCNG